METKRFVALAAALAVALLPLALAVPAAGTHSPGSLNYLIATDFLCGLDPSACPAVAAAADGDMIEITGDGTLTLHPKSVDGSGTFVHRNADGMVVGSGAWTADKLLTFVSYGSGSAQGLPEEFWGGRAQIAVTLWVDGTPVFGAVLWIYCTIGDPIPGGAAEGVRLNVKDGPNFNKQVSGFTLFVNTG